MNNVTLVGRLVHDPELKENTDGTKTTIIHVAVSRDYRNSEGIYETDFIKCLLWNSIASTTKEYCHKGDVVGIKGRLQNNAENGTIRVVADKIPFLSRARS